MPSSNRRSVPARSSSSPSKPQAKAGAPAGVGRSAVQPQPVSATDEKTRRFEAETLAIQSLRLIAAPKPQDDLTQEQTEARLAAMSKNPSFSSDLIQQLIDCIKGI